MPLPAAISVLGAGAWGTALAVLLAGNIKRVQLWGRNRAAQVLLARDRCNAKDLPGIKLPANIHTATEMENVAAPPLNFLLAVPSHGFHQTLRQLHTAIIARGHAPDAATIVWATKGFAADGKLLSEAVAEIFGAAAAANSGVLSGPSFAAETARGLPTALTLACNSRARAAELAGWFRTATARIYFSDDVVGVQLGAAIKNVMAIAAGVSDGLGFGANARAALITRGLAELTRLGIALGGRAETFAGLTGLGDLILTCTDDQSRNRRFGLGLGRGKKPAEIQRAIGREIEGLRAVEILRRRGRECAVDMPITEQVHRILHGADPREAVRALLSRDAKSE